MEGAAFRYSRTERCHVTPFSTFGAKPRDGHVVNRTTCMWPPWLFFSTDIQAVQKIVTLPKNSSILKTLSDREENMFSYCYDTTRLNNIPAKNLLRIPFQTST
jgi:hypothetical protein